MKYILSFSGGKDSCASVILAHEHNEPLDLIMFVEVMFDNVTSGEIPEHINFIKNIAFPLFELWGYKTIILHSKRSYLDCFNHICVKGESKGKRKGFLMSGHCDVQNYCKLKPIRDFKNSIDDEIIEYVGIASDEKIRLNRLLGTNKISLLDKFGFTESMAFDICKKYNLLSPLYNFSKRGGCWFCPNATDRQLKYIRKYYPDLWSKLLSLELNSSDCVGNIWNTLAKKSILGKELQFKSEDLQYHISDFFEF